MKICKDHIFILKRGMTYQVVPSEECEICKLLKKYED
jgi:hypothetical protein